MGSFGVNFDEPFEAQAKHLRKRLANQVTTEKWDDMLGEAHNKVFTVAGAMKADLLADLADAVGKSKGLKQFQEDFKGIVEKHGWDYNGDFDWRTRTIYMTNLRTSYAAGRLEQLQDYPHWMYKHSDLVTNPRQHHKAWSGLTLPADDPWWRSHYPPNGWGCQCRIIGIRRPEETKRYKGYMGEAPPIKIDPKTGAPQGIDRGWDYMPGRNWQSFDKNAFVPDCSWSEPFKNLSESTEGRPTCIRPVPDLKTWKDEARPDIRNVPSEKRLVYPGLLPKKESKEDALKVLADELGVSPENPVRWVQTKAVTINGNKLDSVPIVYSFLPHLVEKRLDLRERFAPLIIPTLQDPYEVWSVLYNDGSIRPRYIGLFDGPHNMMVVVRINKDGSLFYNIIPANNRKMNKQREGVLVYGK